MMHRHQLHLRSPRCCPGGCKGQTTSALLAALLGSALLAAAPLARAQDAAPPSIEAPAGEADEPEAPAGPGSEAAPDGPTAAQIADARVRYQRGLELYKSGDFKLALIEFQRAYEIAPNYRILFNVGQVNMQLNRYAKALRAFEQYLAEGGEAIDEERRNQIEMELGMLRGRTATVTVTSNVDGAVVQIDGVPVGETPLSALLVDAGEHNITVSAEGRSKSEYVVLAGKEEASLNILVPQPAPVAPPAPPPPPSTIVIDNTKPDRGVGWPVIVGWSVTGAITAAAVATGVAALGAQGDLDEVRSRRTTQSELDDANAEATVLSVTTDVLIGAAVLAGGVSLYLTLTDGDDEEGVELGIGPGSLQLTGTF